MLEARPSPFTCQADLLAVNGDMPFNIVFSNETEYLLCISDGSVDDAEEYINWGMQAVKKAKEFGHTRILFDNRTFSLNLSSLDVVTFANKYEEMNIPLLGLRMAVLSNPKNHEVSRLIETTLTNRSATYQRFGSQAEAVGWLLEQGELGESIA